MCRKQGRGRSAKAKKMKEIGIGLLGFGTVGSGVVRGLALNKGIIGDRLGVLPVVRKIADLDLDSDRGVQVDPAILTQDAESVIKDSNVEIIVELIGGIGAARDLVIQSLKLGKPVITANKALLAEHGAEIFELARKNNVDIYFGASVGGGIPIVRALREGMTANRITSIHGILNGTCNYILTRMEKEQLSFEAALREAQAAGFAEADPSLDIDGFDTAHKAVILASLAYGSMFPMEAVHVEGIRDLSDLDIRYALDFGYRIKLLAVIKQNDGKVEVRVHPTLVPCGKVLASIDREFNAVLLRGDLAGDTLYYGRGAGQEPTASTVIADIADVARNMIAGSPRRVPAIAGDGKLPEVRKMAEIRTRYYLRLSLLDRPGTLSRIAAVLGDHNISIASVLQQEVRTGEHVPVIMVTQQAVEKELDASLAAIDAMDVVGARTVRLRIED
jgi:homoserine dehydrogenase